MGNTARRSRGELLATFFKNGHNRFKQNIILFFLFQIAFTSTALFSQEEDPKTKFDFSGSFRVRGGVVARDMLLNRTTPNYKVQDSSLEQQTNQQNFQNYINQQLNLAKQGLPVQNSKKKEEIQFYDTRFLYNMNFTTSKYVEGLWGMQVGDIPFGGRGLPVTPGPGGYDPNLVGPGSGGEQGRSQGVNVQTNFLYINLKWPEQFFSAKVGLQLFSSPLGRVMFATGTGVTFSKTFQFIRLVLEFGGLRGRDKNYSDNDSNGFFDKTFQSQDIFFLKFKLDQWSFMKNELYSYWQSNRDRVNNEYGDLYWTGFFNEFNFSRHNFIVHGIYNYGNMRVLTPIRNPQGVTTFNTERPHTIKGGMYDFQYSYRFSDVVNASLVAVGTTGRPGFEKDGTSSNLKGNGYRTLAPGFAISNLAVDFTGGYAIFNGQTFSGLNQYGGFVNWIGFSYWQFTLGYYQLWSSISPEIQHNRNFTETNGYRTSTYMGQEYNFNIRVNLYRDLVLIFRSGIFRTGDGLRAYLDTKDGTNFKEAFFTLEHRF